jgi:hypothetical protein
MKEFETNNPYNVDHVEPIEDKSVTPSTVSALKFTLKSPTTTPLIQKIVIVDKDEVLNFIRGTIHNKNVIENTEFLTDNLRSKIQFNKTPTYKIVDYKEHFKNPLDIEYESRIAAAFALVHYWAVFVVISDTDTASRAIIYNDVMNLLDLVLSKNSRRYFIANNPSEKGANVFRPVSNSPPGPDYNLLKWNKKDLQTAIDNFLK